MRIGIISDTHGSRAAVERAVSMAGPVELWLHAGDCIQDADYLSAIAGVPVQSVAGNCDWPNPSQPEDRLVEAAGHRILLTHGHGYGVRYDTDRLVEAAEAAGADIAVYGHTHVADVENGEVEILNPGSAARPRDGGAPSFMTAELEPGKPPEVQLLRMEP